MIIEILFLFAAVLSLIGMAAIVRRKIPFLLDLSFQEANSSIFVKLKDRAKKNSFSKNALLQKFLSRVRILILKSDNKTNEWISRLRQKSQKNKTKFSDSYWDKLRK